MTQVAALEAYAGALSEAATKSTTAAGKQHEYINGGPTQDVITESGPVPTIAKQARLFSEAIPDAVVELSGQMTNGKIHTTFAEGRTSVALNQYFWVAPGDSGLDRVALFKKTGDNTQEYAFSYAGGIELDALIRQIPALQSESEHLQLTDVEGGELLRLTARRLITQAFTVVSEDGVTSLGDSEGSQVLYSDAERTIIGGLEIMWTEQPGVFITDREGGVLGRFDGLAEDELPTKSSVLEDGFLFSPVIATAETYDSFIYPQSLLLHRDRLSEIVATVASTTTGASATGQELAISAKRYGASAVLNIRASDNPSARKMMNLQLKNVPIQTVPSSPKILIIGDSIGNRQGGYLLKQILEELGFTPKFIGTMRGSDSSTSAGNDKGELGECREGWETGDYTNSITDRRKILAPGDEDVYRLSMSKNDQRDHNPFGRAAIAGDPARIVRNGIVFDCAFYQARFGLETPDIVLQMLGTNDFRDRSAAEIHATILANDGIINSQIRAAWPNAKIIRTIPGTSVTGVRNELWVTHYAPGIRAMRESAAALADNKLTIAPVWAMCNHEGGYDFSATEADDDGFVSADWSDPIHPTGSARHSLYRALAPYVAAAAINLI